MSKLILKEDETGLILNLEGQIVKLKLFNKYEKYMAYRDLIIYISYLALYTDKGKMYYFENKECIDYFILEIKNFIKEEKNTVGLGYGFAGVGYMLYILGKLTNRYEKMFNELNKYILNYFKLIENNQIVLNIKNNFTLFKTYIDYFNGLIGILNYMELIGEDNIVLRKVLLQMCETMSEKKDFDKVPLGIAHGISGILLYIVQTSYLTSDEKKYYLNKFYQKIKHKKIIYGISSDELSWGNGIFGYLYVYSILKWFLNKNFNNEIIKIFKIVNYKKYSITKKNVCSGYFGCKKMIMNLFEYKMISEEVKDKFINSLNNKFINKDFLSEVSVKEISIINGILNEKIIEILNEEGKRLFYRYYMI